MRIVMRKGGKEKTIEILTDSDISLESLRIKKTDDKCNACTSEKFDYVAVDNGSSSLSYFENVTENLLLQFEDIPWSTNTEYVEVKDSIFAIVTTEGRYLEVDRFTVKEVIQRPTVTGVLKSYDIKLDRLVDKVFILEDGTLNLYSQEKLVGKLNSYRMVIYND